MITSKYRLFKLSILVTPYDKHLNPDHFTLLSSHSETITSSKYASKTITTEEWQNFYTHTNCEVYAYITPQYIMFVLIINNKEIDIKEIDNKENKNKEINILTLYLSTVPNIKCQTRDKTLQIKYYIDWEKKYQLSFYTEDEMKSYRTILDDALVKMYGDVRWFVEGMDGLFGDVDGDVDGDGKENKETYKEMKEEFLKLVNKGIEK